MAQVGDRLALVELISRAGSENAVVSLTVDDGLVTVIYRKPDAPIQEYWQVVPGEDYLVFKHILTNPHAKIE